MRAGTAGWLPASRRGSSKGADILWCAQDHATTSARPTALQLKQLSSACLSLLATLNTFGLDTSNKIYITRLQRNAPVLASLCLPTGADTLIGKLSGQVMHMCTEV